MNLVFKHFKQFFTFSQLQLWDKPISRIPLLTLLSLGHSGRSTNLRKITLSSQDFVQPSWKI